MHGGSVAVSSDGPDRGATFEVRLPLAKIDTADRTTDERLPVPVRSILVVDDNRDAADALAALLQIDGYELARRIRADEALHHVRLIAITGYGQEEDKARALSAGFAAHLLKPVE